MPSLVAIVFCLVCVMVPPWLLTKMLVLILGEERFDAMTLWKCLQGISLAIYIVLIILTIYSRRQYLQAHCQDVVKDENSPAQTTLCGARLLN